jgi:peptide/nickel transport system substrate-binding protein
MSTDETSRLDAVRHNLNERQNHVIDEFRHNGLSRRDFIRAASVAGLSLPLAGMFAGSASAVKPAAKAVPSKRKPLLRVSTIAPGSKIDPVIANNGGALLMLGLGGEYLSFSNNNLTLEPRVAESWKANADSTLWTFKIRKGITFHGGAKLTADDVVKTFDRLADPANKSNALSVFKGLLQKGNTKKVDDYTVTFQLDVPTGAFPYLVSSDNYNSIILPKDYVDGTWEKNFIGCGPWILEKYVVDQGATFKRNPTYWDKNRQPNFEKLQITQLKDDSARLAGLQSGQFDWDALASSTTAKTLQGNAGFTVSATPSVGHLQIHMKCDSGPLADKRIRQAIALSLDRPGILGGVIDGFGVVGNDSPMAPAYPTTDKTVAQRKKDIAQAKSLLAAAGKDKGLDVTLSSWDRADIKLLAQVVQASCKEIGVNVTLNITDAGTYYDDTKSPSWLKSDFGITEYGHRGVPNVYLDAALKTNGVWNAAKFSSKDFDAATKSFIESPDLQTQKAAAKKIQEVLLDESPIVFSYFASSLDVSKKGLTGNYTTGINVLETTRAKLA